MKATFNDDIGSWDLSRVTSTENMFDGARAFNQPIGAWDLSRVTSTVRMFRLALAFNQDVGGWDVSSAANMKQMFFQAYAFSYTLCGDSWVISRSNAFQLDMFQHGSYVRCNSGQIPIANLQCELDSCGCLWSGM